MGSARVSNRVSSRRAGPLAVACVIAAMTGAAAPAQAQDPGVTFEPGSPSGKEYAIPLEEARRDAGGERPGSAGSLPFGIGISSRAGGGPGSQPGGAGERGARERGERSGVNGTERAASEPRGLQERLAEAESAAAPAVWTVLPLLLVLLPGLLLALALLTRRGSREPAG
ncbi:MAG: hypothetical protein ACR2KP_05515 [Egibacteraceae bacterium]